MTPLLSTAAPLRVATAPLQTVTATNIQHVSPHKKCYVYSILQHELNEVSKIELRDAFADSIELKASKNVTFSTYSSSPGTLYKSS